MSNLFPNRMPNIEPNVEYGSQGTGGSLLVIVIVFIVVIAMIVLAATITFKRYKLASEALETGHTSIAAEALAPEVGSAVGSIIQEL